MSAAMAGGASNFIGSLISLISKSDIRYQGFLATIDAEQATIALEKVRSWGTEGRLVQQGKPSNEELPPNDNVYDYIVFRAADVKDLKIDDPHPPRNAPAPPPPQPPQDPAIMNAGPPGPYGSPYGRPPPPGHGFPGPPPGGSAPPPGVQFGGPGNVPYGRPPQAPFQAPQSGPGPQGSTRGQAPAAGPAAPSQTQSKLQPGQSLTSQQQAPSGAKPRTDESKGKKNKEEQQTDAVTEHLSKLSVAGQANLPQGPANGKSNGAGSMHKADPSLPAIPRAAAAAAAAAATSGNRTVPGSGGRQRGPHSSVFDNPSGRGGQVEVPDADFDFDASNAKFAKESKLNGTGQEEEKEQTESVLTSIPPPSSDVNSFYDKSSFFDSISNEVTERIEAHQQPRIEERDGDQFGGRGGGRGRGNGRGRADRLAEERRNMATFGEVGTFGGGGPRGRGRGRGGRGRGRGGRGRGDGFRGGRGGGQSAMSTFQ